jgi:hypothetical protein
VLSVAYAAGRRAGRLGDDGAERAPAEPFPLTAEWLWEGDRAEEDEGAVPFGAEPGYTTGQPGFAGWVAHWHADKEWFDAA